MNGWKQVGLAWFSAMVCLSLPVTVGAQASRSAEKVAVGYVDGNDVYVRSGFSTNYYPVTKLNRGDKVEIVGEEFGWLKILPPQGTHSLVVKSYVDRQNEDAGVINEATWVFAGSNINDRHYAKQVKLAKGSKVQILGTAANGDFYKIVPPAGAYLWITDKFVDRSDKLANYERAESPSEPALETVAPGELDLDDSSVGLDELPELDPVATTRPAARQVTTRPSPAELNEFQVQINAIEAEIAAESTEPLVERDFTPMIEKLATLADQDKDPKTQIYAQVRMDQLKQYGKTLEAVRKLRRLKADAISRADVIATERRKIAVEPTLPTDRIVARGELRASQVYDGSGNRPKRWRLVNPESYPPITIALIELPPGSPINPVQYYGHYVGIKASAHRTLPSTSPPLSLYTVEEIVLLDPQAEGGNRSVPTADTVSATQTDSESE